MKYFILFITFSITSSITNAQSTVSANGNWDDCDTWGSNNTNIGSMINGVSTNTKTLTIPNYLGAKSNYITFPNSSSVLIFNNTAYLTLSNSGASGGPESCLSVGSNTSLTLSEAGHCKENYSRTSGGKLNLGGWEDWDMTASGIQSPYKIPSDGDYTIEYKHVHISNGEGISWTCYLSDFDIRIKINLDNSSPSISELAYANVWSGAGYFWATDGCGLTIPGSSHSQFYAFATYTGYFYKGQIIQFAWQENRHSASNCNPRGITRAEVFIRRNS